LKHEVKFFILVSSRNNCNRQCKSTVQCQQQYACCVLYWKWSR